MDLTRRTVIVAVGSLVAAPALAAAPLSASRCRWDAVMKEDGLFSVEPAP